jgi:class 3 adenylate cyclase
VGQANDPTGRFFEARFGITCSKAACPNPATARITRRLIDTATIEMRLSAQSGGRRNRFASVTADKLASVMLSPPPPIRRYGKQADCVSIAVMNSGRERVERRLAAVLAADVAGYSRLMGEDEEVTHADLTALRREVSDPKVTEHRGRIVKTTGDGLLVEFASVVDAVRFAVELQCEMARRNADVPQARRIELRIGINLGDIIIDADDIYGDGVNVAARLEALAEPGGICVSKVVRDQVRDKVDFGFEDLGEQQVKNIARPVHVYRIATSGSAVTKSALPLLDKPSLAVLPFQNMSGDPEQEYFADGMVEEITTAISRLPWLFVIARNSSFTYKGRAVDVKQVARELGCAMCSKAVCGNPAIACASPAVPARARTVP